MANESERHLNIGGRVIGPGRPAYVVAELSANHRQEFSLAVELVHAAKQAGADAVKVQTYTPDTLTICSDRRCFRISGGTPWDGRTLYELYGDAYMPWDWQPRLKQIADNIGISFFSSPFDETAVEFLEDIDVPAYKVASFEIVDIPLIERIAATGKPLIISTGMASQEEIGEAVAAARGAGANEIALLKCTSAYPASPESMNLAAIPRLAKTFSVPVGLSDHSRDPVVAITAVALGACIVETHFALDRSDGPDAAFSLAPQEFSSLVEAIRTAESAIGTVCYEITAEEAPAKRLRRSLFVVEDVAAGETLSVANVRSIRPADGLPPKHLGEVLGRVAAQDIKAGTPLAWDLICDREPPDRAFKKR